MSAIAPSFERLAGSWRGGFAAAARAVRNHDVALVALAAMLGAAVGVGVVVLETLVQLVHESAFLIAPGGHLSAAPALAWWGRCWCRRRAARWRALPRHSSDAGARTRSSMPSRRTRFTAGGCRSGTASTS